MYGDRFRKFAPVKEGDEIDVKIEAVGEKGDGIAKKDGFVLVVPGTAKGDEVRIRVTKVLRRVGFAEVVGKSQGGSSETEPEPIEDTEEFADDETADDTEEDASDDEDVPLTEQPEDSEDFGEELED